MPLPLRDQRSHSGISLSASSRRVAPPGGWWRPSPAGLSSYHRRPQRDELHPLGIVGRLRRLRDYALPRPQACTDSVVHRCSCTADRDRRLLSSCKVAGAGGHRACTRKREVKSKFTPASRTSPRRPSAGADRDHRIEIRVASVVTERARPLSTTRVGSSVGA